ncbi:hypothetical protein CAEBREN_02204 [Caenorhabditis brenneri]|uniref:PAN-3 domain-containing protein n=1 Tax=Caenorhabditis brenneri TaxID=135651 RepID=G0NU44_CAEBE|nr:hypothetical protein CAEBREN_02204 [Caenorhabditis brenneri]
MILSGLLLTIFITFVVKNKFPKYHIHFFLFQKSQNTMMVVWGKPTLLVNTAPHFNKTNKWTECIQSCYDWKLCVVAFQNTTGCNLYTYDMPPILKKTNAAEGSKVAVRAINSEKGACPIGINYQNASVSLMLVKVSYSFRLQGYLYDDTAFFPIKVYYNVSLTGSYWKFSVVCV